MSSEKLNIVAIDFDGVIHRYSKGWADGTIYDPPIPEAFEAIKQFMIQGYNVFIFSTRDPNQIKEWFDKVKVDYDLPFPTEIIPINTDLVFWEVPGVIGITNIKLAADIYIDDRAFRFEGDWAQAVNEIKNLLEKFDQ